MISDSLSFLIDGEDREYLQLADGVRLSDILEFDQRESNYWQYGSRLAPFDQEVSKVNLVEF